MQLKQTRGPRSFPNPLRAAPEEAQPVQFFDALAWLALVVALVVLFATFRDYGVPWDAEGEVKYGKLLVRYYTSWFRDHSAFEFINFRFYGGGFELPFALISKLSPFGVYETRHLVSGLLGIVGMAATWRLARALGGARAGAVAAWLLMLNPSWYGHSFINVRDVPFGAGMITCLLLSLRMLDELPRISWRSALAFGLALGLTTSVRVGGVLALVFLLAPIGLWWLGRLRAPELRATLLQDTLRIAGSLLHVIGAAYAVIAVLWPWAIQSPLNPWRALTMFSRFPFEENVLFDGKLVPASDLPASYLPVQFVVRQPESLLLGLAAVGLIALWGLRRLSRARVAALTESSGLRWFAVAFAGLFPFVYFIALRPVAYNGMRHFLFVVPTLTALAALAYDRLLQAPARPLRLALAGGLLVAGVAQTRELVELHPNQYVYFNHLVGGVNGAEGRFELDFWGTSLAEAAEEFADELESRGDLPEGNEAPFKIYVCGNMWSAALFFPRGLEPVSSIEQADFQIAINNHFCKHPTGSRQLLDVKREGAVLSYVDDMRSLRRNPKPAESVDRPAVSAKQHGAAERERGIAPPRPRL
ncbi:MAG: hypothetical protein ABW321_25260 [Polyangiales bacterium]